MVYTSTWLFQSDGRTTKVMTSDTQRQRFRKKYSWFKVASPNPFELVMTDIIL